MPYFTFEIRKKDNFRATGLLYYIIKGNGIILSLLKSHPIEMFDYIGSMEQKNPGEFKFLVNKDLLDVIHALILKAVKKPKKDKSKDKSKGKKVDLTIIEKILDYLHSVHNKMDNVLRAKLLNSGILATLAILLKHTDGEQTIKVMELVKNYFIVPKYQEKMMQDGIVSQILVKLKSQDDTTANTAFNLLKYFDEHITESIIEMGLFDICITMLNTRKGIQKVSILEFFRTYIFSFSDDIIMAGLIDSLDKAIDECVEGTITPLFEAIVSVVDIFKPEKLKLFPSAFFIRILGFKSIGLECFKNVMSITRTFINLYGSDTPFEVFTLLSEKYAKGGPEFANLISKLLTDIDSVDAIIQKVKDSGLLGLLLESIKTSSTKSDKLHLLGLIKNVDLSKGGNNVLFDAVFDIMDDAMGVKISDHDSYGDIYLAIFEIFILKFEEFKQYLDRLASIVAKYMANYFGALSQDHHDSLATLLQKIVSHENYMSTPDRFIIMTGIISSLQNLNGTGKPESMDIFVDALLLHEEWTSYVDFTILDRFIGNLKQKHQSQALKILNAYGKLVVNSSGLVMYMNSVELLGLNEEEIDEVLFKLPMYQTCLLSLEMFNICRGQGIKVTNLDINKLVKRILKHLRRIQPKITDDNTKVIFVKILIAVLTHSPLLFEESRDLLEYYVTVDFALNHDLLPLLVDFVQGTNIDMTEWIVKTILTPMKSSDLVEYKEQITTKLLSIVKSLTGPKLDTFVQYLTTHNQVDFASISMLPQYMGNLLEFLNTGCNSIISLGLDMTLEFLKSIPTQMVDKIYEKHKYEFESLALSLVAMLINGFVQDKTKILDILERIHPRVFLTKRFQKLDLVMLDSAKNDPTKPVDSSSIFSEDNLNDISGQLNDFLYSYFTMVANLGLSGFESICEGACIYSNMVIAFKTISHETFGYCSMNAKSFLFYIGGLGKNIEFDPIEKPTIEFDGTTLKIGGLHFFSNFELQIQGTKWDGTHIASFVELYDVEPHYGVGNHLIYNQHKLNAILDDGPPIVNIFKLHEISAVDFSVHSSGLIRSRLIASVVDPVDRPKILNTLVSRYLNEACSFPKTEEWEKTTHGEKLFDNFETGAKAIIVEMEESGSIFAICFKVNVKPNTIRELNDVAIVSLKSTELDRPFILRSKGGIPFVHNSSGLYLGRGCDLYINPQEPQLSFSNLGFSFQLPSDISFMSSKARKLLSGVEYGSWKFKSITTYKRSLGKQQVVESYGLPLINFSIFAAPRLPIHLRTRILELMSYVFPKSSDIRLTNDLEKIKILRSYDTEFVQYISNELFNSDSSQIFEGISLKTTRGDSNTFILEVDKHCTEIFVTNLFVHLNESIDSKLYVFASSGPNFTLSEDLESLVFDMKVQSQIISDSSDSLTSSEINDPVFGFLHKFVNGGNVDLISNRYSSDKICLVGVSNCNRLNEIVLAIPSKAKYLIVYCPQEAMYLNAYALGYNVKKSKGYLGLPVPTSRLGLIAKNNPEVLIEQIDLRNTQLGSFSGILDYLGTFQRAVWENPYFSGQVDLTLSHNLFSEGMVKSDILRKDCQSNTYWGGTMPQSFTLTFKRSKVQPTAITLRHGYSLNNSFLHNFKIEGSNDGVVWKLLHGQKRSPFSRGFQVVTIAFDECEEYYNIIKLTQMGGYTMIPNGNIDNGAPFLCISGLEIFGNLIEMR